MSQNLILIKTSCFVCLSENETLTFNSPIVTAEVLAVSDHLFSNLSQPVVLIFPHTVTSPIDANQSHCLFISRQLTFGSPYDVTDDAWEGSGCYAVDVNATHTTCHCFHLTNFALLIDIHNVRTYNLNL